MTSEDNLKRNKCKRKTIRGSVTKLIKQIEEEIDKRDESSIDVIEDSLEVLLEYKNTLENLDSLIENDTDAKNLETEISSTLEYNEAIVLCRSRAKRYLGKIRKDVNSIPAINNVAELNESKSKTYTKLPQISLDKFSGDICKFQEFWPQYKAAIHDNESLHDIEKFNYLKTLVSDSAATAISGLPLTTENYKKAIEILEDRFGKKDVLISAHTNRLLNLEPIKKSNDTLALRNMYDEISVQIRNLESLGITIDSYGCLLLPILYKCIPNDLVLQFHREQSKSESNVSDLLAYLKNEVEAREKAKYVVRDENLKSEYKPKPNMSKTFNPEKRKNKSAFA